MTATEVLAQAQAAGLVLERAPGGLRIRGPKAARTALKPVLVPLASEILRLLPRTKEGEPSVSHCTECHRESWPFLVSVDGDRVCADCLHGRTAMRTGYGGPP